MSEFSFDDLPEDIKQIIEEFLFNLSQFSDEELLQIIRDVFGKETADLLGGTMGSDSPDESYIPIILDEATLKEFQRAMDDKIKTVTAAIPYEEDVEIEPYYEITSPINNRGEIIVELPGVGHIDQIECYEFDGEIYLYTIDTVEFFKLIIPIPNYFRINYKDKKLIHGLFILPYTIE